MSNTINISLTPEQVAALRGLALRLGLPGRKGNGSISALAKNLAEASAIDAEAVADFLTAAFALASGAADEWSTLAALRKYLPDDDQDEAAPVRDPFIRDTDGRIIAALLEDETGRPYTLADMRRANPAEFADFAAMMIGRELASYARQ